MWPCRWRPATRRCCERALRRPGAGGARAGRRNDGGPRGRDTEAAHAPLEAGSSWQADGHAPDAPREHADSRRPDSPRAPAQARRPRRVVMLCDISGSMSHTRAPPPVPHVRRGERSARRGIVFATRLTRLTRALRSRSPSGPSSAPPRPLRTGRAGPGSATPSRRSTTAPAGAQFTRRSDRDPLRGWERGDPALVALRWNDSRASRTGSCGSTHARGRANLSASGGIGGAAHCDALVSGHSLEALEEVVEAIAAERGSHPPTSTIRSPWKRHGRRHPGPGSSVACRVATDRAGGRRHPAGGPMEETETQGKTGIDPAARPGGATASARRATAELLRTGGAQRADRPPGAKSLERGVISWLTRHRAVFLRVHGTGKMVLSLTTESDGNEGRYGSSWPAELGVPALEVKVVPADTDRIGEGHGFKASRRRGPRPDHQCHRQESRQGGAARAPRSTRAGQPHVAERRLRCPGRWRGPQTIADIALYVHGSGALPPGVEGGLDAQTVYRD